MVFSTGEAELRAIAWVLLDPTTTLAVGVAAATAWVVSVPPALLAAVAETVNGVPADLAVRVTTSPLVLAVTAAATVLLAVIAAAS